MLFVMGIAAALSYSFSADTLSIVKIVNSSVASVEDSIQAGVYASLEINEVSTSEGSPAALTMFFKGQRIVMINASVGHETWINEFKYYYYSNGKPMKYLKSTKDRPDNPAREAVIYNDKGEMVWKNTDLPEVSPSELYEVFTKLQKIRLGLSQL